MSSYADTVTHTATSENVTVTANIDNTISIETSTNDINLGALSTKKVSIASTTVTVTTSAEKYNLVINDTDEYNALYLNGDITSDQKIDSSAGVAANTNAWGVRVAGQTTWQIVPKASAAGTELVKDGTQAANGKATVVEFGASHDGTLGNGEYSGAVVFTATADVTE